MLSRLGPVKPVRRWLNARPVVGLILRLGMTGAVLAGVVWYVDIGTALATFSAGSPYLVLLATVLVLPNVLLDAWTWRTVMAPILLSGAPRVSPEQEPSALTSPDSCGGTQRQDLSLPLSIVLRSVLAGYTAAFFTPARAGEFGGRALTLSDGSARRFDEWDVSITVAAQRIVDTLVALSIGWVALAWMRGVTGQTHTWDIAAQTALWVGGAIILLLVAAVLKPEIARRVAQWIAPERTRLQQRFARLQHLRPGILLRVVIGSATRYAVFAGQLVCLVLAFTPASPLPVLALATGVTYYLKFLIPSLTLLDVGVREGAAVLAFGHLGVSEAAALNASLLIFLINIALPAAVGAFFLRRYEIPSQPSREVPEETP